MKKIAVNIPEYIKSVVDLEERIKWASSETVVIPKDMKYPKSGLKGASLYAFIKGILP